jgi:hypothetical protein
MNQNGKKIKAHYGFHGLFPGSTATQQNEDKAQTKRLQWCAIKIQCIINLHEKILRFSNGRQNV